MIRMIPKEKADLKLSCIYAAKNILGIVEGKKEKSTTKKVLVEATKIWQWISEEQED